MGGKTKTSQRTKNNARPSSSGRSAELLNNAAAGIRTVPVLFPSLATINIDQGLSAEYSVCFKKFNKKDPVTKTKALQELTELVKTGNVEDAEAALPSWAHHYQLLTVDSDRRVREATQCCHGALVSACGRRAAPQLRRLLPVWLLAAHDDHAPVGSQAQTHLQNTFPEGKLSEALSFCKSEIMTLLSDNLTGNADAMVGKRTEDEEERQARVSRVLASSLHALQLVVVTLPRAQHDWLWGACVERLLQNNHFWGLLRNPDQHIRAAWYGAMGRIIEQFGSRMSPPVAKKAAKALVAEPERNARVAAQRWAALLLLMKHVAEWHLLLEKKDLLITRVLDMIENGAWGEARLLSSMLVPLLASLPPDLLTKHFYIKFFDAIFTSLNNKNVLNSKSERQTWVSNISECVRHLSTQNHDFVVEVTTYVHRTWLERVLDVTNSQARSNLTKHSMTNMSSLIKHWLNLSKLENEKYDQLTRNFWQNFCSTILTRIDKLSIEQEDIVQSIETHILLLKTLHTTFLYEPRKKLSIQFEDQVADTIKIDSTTEKIVNCDEQLKERFVHNLNDLARKTCCGYLDLAHKKQVSQAVCPVLVNLLMEFDDRDMFVALARHFGADSAYGFYDRCLRPWLAGDTMRCQALVEMVFLMVKYLSEDEQDRMFTSFQQFPPPVVEWCIHLTLSHPHSLLPAGKRWMRGSVVEATVVALCQREGDSKAASLLLACVADDDTGDVIVSESTVVRVVGAVSARLEGGARDEHALRRARTAAELAGALLSGAARAHAPPLLSALLRYQLRLSQNSEQHGTAAWSEVWEAWRDALPARCRHPLLTRALHDLRDHVLHDITELDIKRIENAASLCPCLFGTSADNKPSIADIVSLAKQLFTHVETEQPKTPLELYALRCDCIHGHISPAFQRNNELCKRIGSTCEENHEELSKDDLMISVYKSLFRVYFLRKITLNVSEDDVERNSWCNLLLSDSYFKEELGQVLYDYAVMNTLFEYYAFWPNYEIINQTKKQMESVLEDIITDITVQTKDAIYSFLTESFAKKGFYGPFARKLFENKFNEVTAKIREQQNKTTDSPSELLENSLSEQENDVLNGNIEQNISENAQNNAKTLDHNNYVTTAEDNVCKSKIDQKDSKDDSQENLEAKLLQGDSENTLKVQNYALQSEQSNSKTEIVQKTSEPESDQKNNEFKSEMKNLESKSNQNKSESVSEQIISKSEQSKSSSDSEQSKTESTSEHHEAHELFADKSVYVDEAKWTELLGFPSLQEVVSNSEYYLHLQAEAKYSPEASRDLSTRYMAMMRGVLCAHVHEPAAAVQLLADVADATAAGPDPVINGYYKRRHLMLFERAVTGVPWVQVLSNVAVVDYLGELVQLRGAAMHANHWDFVNIALSSLLESVHLTAHRWATTNVSALLRATTRLLTRVHAFMRALRCSAEAPPARLSALLREWDDIFVPDINRHLFTILLAVLRSTDTPITASSAATIGSLIAAARYMEWRGEASGTPGVSVEGLAEAAISALRGMTHHAYKYLAFHTLELMAKPLVFEDAQKLKEWNPEEDAEKPRPANCFRLFDDAMSHLHECTEAALANVQLCEGTCEMVPFSDSHGVSLSYMLLAASLQRACSFARGDLHHVYTAQFRDGMYAVGLMSCTLRLLPGAVAEFAFMRGPALSPDVLQCFQRLPALDVYERCSAGTVSALACYVMTETLGGAGAADARVWSGTAPARVPAALRRLVTAAVTPVLLQRHLTQLRDRADELSDTRVSIAWSRGEVQCWLELEEHELELTVRLAPDHPLSPPALATSPHSPAPDTSWLVMYLAYQNGTLLNALKMWRRALNARLQSAPQCYVCYMHLHPASGRLPAKRCHQCRNKFHAECLNKWFKHNPTKICPLCRAKMAPRHQSQS